MKDRKIILIAVLAAALISALGYIIFLHLEATKLQTYNQGYLRGFQEGQNVVYRNHLNSLMTDGYIDFPFININNQTQFIRLVPALDSGG